MTRKRESANPVFSGNRTARTRKHKLFHAIQAQMGTSKGSRSPQEFLRQMERRDPAALSRWERLLDVLRAIRQAAAVHMEDFEQMTAELGWDDPVLLLISGIETLDQTKHQAILAALKRVIDLFGQETSATEITHELQIEWDTLAAVSDFCLAGGQNDFHQRQLIHHTPAGAVWRLWHPDMGEFGEFSVSKLRPGWAQIRFSGCRFTSLAGEEQRRIKHRQMRKIVAAYYRLLVRQNIWFDPPELAARQTVPWMNIPDKNHDRRILELWYDGLPVKEIAARTHLSAATVYNALSRLRREHPHIQIPYRKKVNPSYQNG